jgi:FixJ family two-component response regulator
MVSQGKVFVVDDEPAVRKALERLLRAAGFEVRLFASSAELLAAIEGDRPGCLLLDYQMPGMNGLELQAALAARSVDTQIVFLTGHADVPESARAMEGGAVAFLRKPAGGDQLLPAVRSALERSARRRR